LEFICTGHPVIITELHVVTITASFTHDFANTAFYVNEYLFKEQKITTRWHFKMDPGKTDCKKYVFTSLPMKVREYEIVLSTVPGFLSPEA
jgi:hypothetical protein